MHKTWFSYCITVILVGVLGALLYTYISVYARNEELTVVSPLPDFLTKLTNKQVSTIELFLPLLGNAQADESIESKIQAKSVLAFDLNTDKTLYSKNATKRLPMASLTKIMTAIIAIENKKESDKYVVREENIVGENSMGVSAGEILTLNKLLYGLILRSGNDAAEVIAANFTAGRAAFIGAMNDKAKSLGLSNTNFTNPSGLQGDGIQYSTAYDLLVMTRYALQHPEFAEVAATYIHEITRSSTHKDFYLENETNLLSTYPGVKGVKTGYTPEAGLCLVTFLEYKGHRIVGVLLGSENRRQEMKDLLDYSLEKLGTHPPSHD